MAAIRKHKPIVKLDNSEEKRNITWERVQIQIDAAVDELAKELKRLPSVQEIADKTKLSYNTIYRHHKDAGLDKYAVKYRPYLNKVLATITAGAVAGDTGLIDRYLELVYDKHRRQELSGPGGEPLGQVIGYIPDNGRK